ncbi:MAG: GNAT family N-acetyltransferase [Gemmatimonadota bacterium]|nr:GNAT family N-acetyltransferase [Gemmatimonadota bacterium]
MQPSAPERVGSEDDRGTAALHIRAATEADIPELSKLRYQFRSALAPAVEEADAFRERSALWMRERLGAGLWFCWVAEDDTGIRGNVWIQLVEKIPTPTDEPEIHAYLTNFFVTERARAQGVGSALLRCALEWSRTRGVHLIFLWPTRRTRKLYERHGFSADGDAMQLLFAPRAQ